MPLKRTLVLGGSGTVGTRLCAELTERGINPLVGDRGNSVPPNLLKVDISDYRQLEHLFAKHEVGYVYNLAAEFGRWNGEAYYENLWRTNVIGFKHLLRLQERIGFRLVHFSSSEVYGDFGGVMDETVPDKNSVHLLNDYAMTKRVNEMQAKNSAIEYGTETVVVRLFNTYGPGESYSIYRSALCIFAHSALHDLPYTVYLGHRRTSSFIDDTCRTLANISRNFKPGETYNIAGTKTHTMEEASNLILEILGTDDSLVTYKPAERYTTATKLPDSSKAIRDLDHKPSIDLREGLTRTIAWMRRLAKTSGANEPSDWPERIERRWREQRPFE